MITSTVDWFRQALTDAEERRAAHVERDRLAREALEGDEEAEANLAALLAEEEADEWS